MAYFLAALSSFFKVFGFDLTVFNVSKDGIIQVRTHAAYGENNLYLIKEAAVKTIMKRFEDDLARNFDELQSDHWRFIKSHALIALGTVNIIYKFANFLKTKLPYLSTWC